MRGWGSTKDMSTWNHLGHILAVSGDARKAEMSVLWLHVVRVPVVYIVLSLM